MKAILRLSLRTVSERRTVFRLLMILGLLAWAIIAAHAQVACPVPQGPNWTVRFVDSEELVGEGGQPKGNVIDRDPATMWHTEWLAASPPPPHEIQIDLGAAQPVSMVGYLPRQDGCSNGWIAQYEVYASTDPANWGTPVAQGTFDYTGIPLGCLGAGIPGEFRISFAQKMARYIRLRALSEVDGDPWSSAAEINVYGPVPFQITTTTLPSGRLGVPYAAQLQLARFGLADPVASPVLTGVPPSSGGVKPPLQRRLLRFPPPAGPPDAFDISPRSGPVGTTITIHGANFRPGGFVVSFGLETGSGMRVGTLYPRFVDANRVTVVVPNLLPGPHDVYVDAPAAGWHTKLTRAFVVVEK